MARAITHQFSCAEDALEAINVVDMLLGSPHLKRNLSIWYSLASMQCLVSKLNGINGYKM